MTKSSSKTDLAILKIPTKLFQEGTVLAIDPSCGSRNSLPAYAIAVGGYLQDAGPIELDIRLPLHRRLYALQQYLQEHIGKPDVLVIEGIAPYFSGGGGGFRNQGTISLHQAVGCIMSAWDIQHLAQIPVASHQALMRRLVGDKYVKTDMHDAMSILACAFDKAVVPLQNLEDLLKEVTNNA